MLQKVVSVKDLAWYLNVSTRQLKELKVNEHYITFEVSKPGSTEKRLIEAPTGWLKFALDRLSDGLQWLYSDHRTSAAHGYIRSVKNDPDKRTIFTNAQKHIGKNYLLNMDFDNFFHQITEEKIRMLLAQSQLFSFNAETEELLTQLVCYNGRLPMGSPTSPPLSNFVVMDLDKELTRWTRHQKIIYTRFVDDLSFSSEHPISSGQFEMINTICKEHHFLPDPEKTKWYGKNDRKEVTGLMVTNKISLPPEYLTALENEIKRYKELKSLILQFPDYQVIDWAKKLEQVINGRLNFVKSTYGSTSKEYNTLLDAFHGLNSIDTEEQSLSWRYAGYEFFS
ncbi:RNA-directed DNA polymerase [Prolixibacteraceae bacterium JC049]|nr:RNA-directed DNA polymerase [Prolixibacteraceae bacterium JC049]